MANSEPFPAARRRQVQDDSREIQLAAVLNLQRSERRTGSDARDESDRRYELKTVSPTQVTTGRDVGPAYFARLRRSYLVVAKGTRTDYGFTIEEIWVVAPSAMEEWLQMHEARWRPLQGIA